MKRTSSSGWFLVGLGLSVGGLGTSAVAADFPATKLQGSDTSADDAFGLSVDMDAGFVVCGAQGADNAKGAAYVWSPAGTQLHRLVAPSAVANDLFGSSVAISGNIVLVGEAYDGGVAPYAGAAHVFDRDTGAHLMRLEAPDGMNGDEFGRAVAIGDRHFFVGAPNTSDQGHASGSVYAFDRTTGAFVHEFMDPSGNKEDHFGKSIDAEGSWLLVGAPYDDDDGQDSGSAFLFSAKTGGLKLHLRPSVPQASVLFGSSVALDDEGPQPTMAIVGAPYSNFLGSLSGAAYLHEIDMGRELALLLPSDGVAFDQFGSAVGLSGRRAMVGAFNKNPFGGGQGQAYLYDTLLGTELAVLVPDDLATSYFFGVSMALEGDRAVVGDSAEMELGHAAGAMWILEGLTPDCDADGVDDFVTVLAGLVPDCNGNLVPDACDLASGTSSDLDGNGVPDDCLAPPLWPDVFELSVSAGGVQSLALDAGPLFASHPYLLLGSGSGTNPGLAIDGLLLPLVVDAYTTYSLLHPNQPPLGTSLGILAASIPGPGPAPGGHASASFTLGPGADPGLIGLTVHHAFLAFDPLVGTALFASNPAPLTFVP